MNVNLRKCKIKNHQTVSFMSAFGYMEKSTDIFWPGCAVLSLGHEISISTYNLLKEQNEKLEYSTFCCGKPSKFVSKSFNVSIKKELEALIEKNQAVNIYTLCPNCFLELSELGRVNVKSAWKYINENFPNEKLNILSNEVYSLHDPCPIYADFEATIHVREILKKLGVKILEFEKNKGESICCGNKNMLMTLNPKKSKEIFQGLKKVIPSENIVTYCASCKNTFENNSYNSKHILELLFDIQGKSSWANRLNEVNKIKRRKDNA